MSNLIVFDEARWLLSVILRQGWPKMDPVQSVKNADAIIKALHRAGMQVGPAVAFGPTSIADWTVRTMEVDRGAWEATHPKRRDVFDGFDDVLADMEERRPWEIR
jgi:hypothetical protein